MHRRLGEVGDTCVLSVIFVGGVKQRGAHRVTRLPSRVDQRQFAFRVPCCDLGGDICAMTVILASVFISRRSLASAASPPPDRTMRRPSTAIKIGKCFIATALCCLLLNIEQFPVIVSRVGNKDICSDLRKIRICVLQMKGLECRSQDDDETGKFLRQLQADAVQSLDEIAQKVGSSKTPVWNRIARMREAGIIGQADGRAGCRGAGV